MTIVIAICGTMGSGKTTAVENIAAALPDCVSLHEDDYNKTTERSLDDIDHWWNRGANVGEFDLSALITQLAVLCPNSVTSNLTAAKHQGTNIPRSPRLAGVGNGQIVLLETHFGRLHPELHPWIDLQCWIDIPADIAVARKIAQLSNQMHTSQSDDFAKDGLRWIENFCKGYLRTTRKLFEMQRQQVRDLSDMSIDGQATALDVCTEFLQRLPEEYKPE